MPAKDVSLRKRQQIAKANKTMFIWIALASIVVGASGVATYALWQRLTFNEAVLSKKDETISNLDHNLSIVDELNNSIRVLNTNQRLIDLSADADAEPIQVIFDALPASPNSTALGSSLQSEQLLSREGITLDSIDVTPIAGVEDAADDGSDEISTDDSGALDGSGDTPTIAFSFIVSTGSGNVNDLKTLIQQLERSIRTITITSTRLENQSDRISLSVSGVAYYEPAKTVEMRNETVTNRGGQ